MSAEGKKYRTMPGKAYAAFSHAGMSSDEFLDAARAILGRIKQRKV